MFIPRGSCIKRKFRPPIVYFVSREKKARLQAKLFQKMTPMEDISSEQMEKRIRENAKTVQLMEDYGLLINDLTVQRKQMPAKIKLSEMPEQYRFDKLKVESKKLKNAVLMLAYRAETA